MASLPTCLVSGLRLAAAQTLKPRTAESLVKTSDRLLRSLSTQASRRATFGQTGLNARASSSTTRLTRSISFTPNSKNSATLSQVPQSAFNQEQDETYGRSDSKTKTDGLPTLTTPAVARWLYLSSGLVFFIVVVGGVTRLTESGLSITEWEPVKGILPPIGEEQWMVEWEKYRVTPEGVLMNSQLDLPAFKRIFYMEWAHRIAGRVLGVGFILPAIYFVSKGKVGPNVRWKLLAIAGGIGFQGFLGWYMVKSGLSQEILETPGAVPRVSQYRLAMHLGAALLLYTGMVHTAIGIKRDWKFAHGEGKTAGVEIKTLKNVLDQPAVRRFGKWAGVVGAMVLFTAVSGAFVAGLDAGLIYNEFPLMGGAIVPPMDEMMDSRYAQKEDGSDKWWRNMLENPTTVQFDHRAFAMTTFAAVASLPFLATRPALRRALPPGAVTWSKIALGAGLLQVSMGITTLLMLVPVPLAAAHQAGSVVLLTTMLGLLGTLRRPSRISRMWAEAKAKRNGVTSFGQAALSESLRQQALRGVKSGMEARVNVP